MTACFDSDVVIDYLQGLDTARQTFFEHDERNVSIVTWIEVMTGAVRQGVEAQVRLILDGFVVHQLDQAISERAVDLRVRYRLRTPDAVVWATALHLGIPLITRNTKDFPAGDPNIRVPYTLERETLERETLERETL